MSTSQIVQTAKPERAKPGLDVLHTTQPTGHDRMQVTVIFQNFGCSTVTSISSC